MRLQAHGIRIELPDRWEGAITVRGQGTATAAERQEVRMPTAHVATFGLPADRGDFGSGAVDLMAGDDCFLALVEYGPECAGTALYRPMPALPQLRAAQFGANRLQRVQRGQAGAQVFCTVAGRAFCVYAVLGSATRVAQLLPAVNQVLAATEVGPR